MSAYTYTDEQHEALARIAEFDHVFAVEADGEVVELDRTRARTPHAPDAVDVDSHATELDGWALPLSGLTGQHGYRGPWLHDSEVIPGGVAEAVLAMPGYWVAIYAQHTCEECSGGGQVWNEDMTDEIPCPAECEPGGTIEGWTMAYRPFPAEVDA